MISSLLKPTVVLNGKKYKIISQIGEGGFAFVYSVRSINKEDKNESYALKKMICQLDEQMSEAKKEIDLMLKIKHPNVLPLIDFSYSLNKKNQSEVYLLLPLYIGSVQTIIDKGYGYPHCSFADGLDVVQILRQTVEGLIAVHSCGFRHADIKPANILLTADYHAVLTDFGSASVLVEQVSNRSEALTIQDKAAQFSTASFRAPELHSTPSNCVIDGKTDIWSMGCLVYNMFYSRTPFESAAEGLSVLAIMSAHYAIPDSNMWPADYLEIIDKCLQSDPAARLTIEELQLRLKRVSSPPLDLIPVIRPTSTPHGQKSNPISPRDVPHTPQTPHTPNALVQPTHVTKLNKGEDSHQPSVANQVAPVRDQDPGVINRTVSLNAGNFADFTSEEAVHVQLSEQLNTEQLQTSPSPQRNLDRMMSRDEFGDKVHHEGQPEQSSSNAVVESPVDEEDFATDEFFSAPPPSDAVVSTTKECEVATVPRLSLASPTVADDVNQNGNSSLANIASRSQFTDSCSTNDTSYVLSDAFDSQSTFTTFGNASPAVNGVSRVQRVPSQSSYGEYVNMEHSSAISRSVSDATNLAGIASGDKSRDSVNFNNSGVSDDAWIIKDAFDNGSQQDKRSSSGTIVVAREDVSGVPSTVGKEEEFGDDDADAFGDFADGNSNADIFQSATPSSVSSAAVAGTQKQQTFFATFPGVEEGLSESRVTMSPDSGAGLKSIDGVQSPVVPPSAKSSIVQTRNTAEEVESIDLHKVIIAQSMSSSSSNNSGGSNDKVSSAPNISNNALRVILKEGPVNILRMGGFPKKLAKKQVWMVLTASGIVIRKDSVKDSKVHELVSLHRPLYLTPTDTMAIGLHGLLIQGSSPRELKSLSSSSSSHHHSLTSMSAASVNLSATQGRLDEEDWITVTLADLTAASKSTTHENNEAKETSNAKVFKSLFSDLKCEVSFESKDVMNEWLDAIEAQKEICYGF